MLLSLIGGVTVIGIAYVSFANLHRSATATTATKIGYAQAEIESVVSHNTNLIHELAQKEVAVVEALWAQGKAKVEALISTGALHPTKVAALSTAVSHVENALGVQTVEPTLTPDATVPA